MKGIIFNQLENMVTEQFGLDAWEAIVESAPLKTKGGAFAGPKTYPDEDLLALVAAASNATGLSVEHLLSAYGRYLLPNLVKLYPVFVKPGMTAKSFMLTIQDVIHVEVRKLHRDASLPTFAYEDPAPDQLVIIYHSPRKLCDLMTGLIEGVGDHFSERIELSQPGCTKRGDSACRLHMTFHRHAS